VTQVIAHGIAKNAAHFVVYLFSHGIAHWIAHWIAHGIAQSAEHWGVWNDIPQNLHGTARQRKRALLLLGVKSQRMRTTYAAKLPVFKVMDRK
jgi:hypothetical protein